MNATAPRAAAAAADAVPAADHADLADDAVDTAVDTAPLLASFAELPLLETLRASLAEQSFKTPTDIQRRTLPALFAGRSVVGVAETGSGKTLAYALPILQALKTLENNGSRIEIAGRPRAVVIVPTRELGEQVAKVFKPFTHTTRLRVRTVLGGTDLDVAKKNIAGPFEVLVATPGRLVKLLDRGLVRFDDVRTLVFDEADQMLDPGFLPDAEHIVGACMPKRQMVLFSATMSATVQALIARLFKDATLIKSQGSHKTPATLKTVHRDVENGDRLSALAELLRDRVAGGTMLFVNTREQCDAVVAAIHNLGHSCVVYRGEMEKLERRNNLKAFREGKVDLLVSTDLASRGLDVEHVGRVINVHLPRDIDNYIHRVGRTARAGRKGLVVNLVTERDRPLLAQIDALRPDGASSSSSSPSSSKPPAPRPPRADDGRTDRFSRTERTDRNDRFRRDDRNDRFSRDDRDRTDRNDRAPRMGNRTDARSEPRPSRSPTSPSSRPSRTSPWTESRGPRRGR